MKLPKSTLSQAIRAASEAKAKQENQQSGKPETKNASPGTEDLMVNLSIKVSKSQRLHWLLEAKKQDTSLTDAIIGALSARFGNPV